MKHMVLTGVALVLLACGRGGPNSPPAPSPSPSPTPSILNVAGTYTGSITFTVGGNPTPVGIYSARMVVVQAGSEVTIQQTWTAVDGQVIPLAAVTGTINATGFFTPAAPPAPTVDPLCGTITPGQSSTTFSGNTVLYVGASNTQFCGNWLFTGTLTK